VSGIPPVSARPLARLGFVDALRGIAASLVVLDHVGFEASSPFRWFDRHVVDVGQLAVVVFFLCSGFVIPATLESGSLGSFWIKRVFRLYPLFWVSVGVAGLLAYLHVSENGNLGPRDWLANLTLIPGAFHAQSALPVYWTLSYEIVFYVLLTLLLLMRLNHLSVETSLLTSAGCALLAVAHPMSSAGRVNAAGFWLATILVGTVLYRWYSGVVRGRTAAICVVAALVAGGTLLGTGLYGHETGSGMTLSRFWPLLIAWVGGYALCFAFYALRRRPLRLLAALGTISYSMYVLHPVVLVVVPLPRTPWLSMAIGLTTTVAVSAVTYRLVERPTMEFGRRLARRRRARVAAGASSGARAPGTLVAAELSAD
jgi:peptidoglycan/LPS O-acetylase OafA/YrhL